MINKEYCLEQGDQIQVKVNKITSTKTQLPYEYYSLDYCKPEKIINSAENLGEVLRGDRIENSPYTVSFLVPLSFNGCLYRNICVNEVHWSIQYLCTS